MQTGTCVARDRTSCMWLTAHANILSANNSAATAPQNGRLTRITLYGALRIHIEALFQDLLSCRLNSAASSMLSARERKALRGGDDVTIAQTELSRCWLLVVASDQLGLLYSSAVRAAATRLAGADRNSMVSQPTKLSRLSSISCFLRARCTTHDAHFFKGKRELGFLSPQNFRLRR